MLAFLADKTTERKLRRFALACHRRTTLDALPELRPLVEAAEAFVDGDEQGRDRSLIVAGGRLRFESIGRGDDEMQTWIRWDRDFYDRGTTLADRAAQCHLLRDIVGFPGRGTPLDRSLFHYQGGLVPR